MAAIAKSKRKKTAFCGVKTAGWVLLPDDGTGTRFRNLRLRELRERLGAVFATAVLLRLPR